MKSRLGTHEFNGELLYKRLNLPKKDDSINSDYILIKKQKLEKNRYLLENYENTNCEEKFDKDSIDTLKAHYCNVLCLIKDNKKLLKEGILDRSSIRERIVSSLREIEKLEKSLHLEDDSLNYNIKFSGENVLYPSENVMFVTLYSKYKGKEIDLLSEMLENGQCHLFGNGDGREEGQNVAVQMRKMLEKALGASNKSLMPNGIIEFAYENKIKTALSSRFFEFSTDLQKELASQLPKTEKELASVVKDKEAWEKLIDTCEAIIATRSQTSLSRKFFNQRMRYILGCPSNNPNFKNPSKKPSMFHKFTRQAVAESFKKYYEVFSKQAKITLRGEISGNIQACIS